jgi:gliding motility-associated-like protein
MRRFKIIATVVFFCFGMMGLAQTPNNCPNYTTVGSSSSSYNPGGNAGCTGAVTGQVSGTAAWSGLSCTGTLVSTVVGGPVSCLTLIYTAVNTNDYATITVNGGGTISITAINLGVNGNVIGPYNCGGSYGDGSITICSTQPFTEVTLTNTGCTSGWVINCADQLGCGGGGGGNAGADNLSTVMCNGTVDLDGLVTGDAGGTWEETTVPPSGAFNIGTGVFDANSAALGIYTFDYVVSGGCTGTDTALFQIEVVAPADATWTPPAGTICANDADIDLNTLLAGTTGGTWSGTGVTGNMFDPSVGTQTLTYTVGTPPCDDVSAQSITITPALDPTWTSPGLICETNGTVDLNALITGDVGGTWSGNGVTGSTFDPTGLNGPIAVTYTVGTGQCAGIDQQDITVSPDVDPSWTPPTTLCETDPLFNLNNTITGTAGGTWSGVGVSGNIFNPAMGTQTVTYSLGTAPCDESETLTITVGATPDASWNVFTACLDDPAVDLDTTITGDPGGTWSGNGIAPPGNTFYPSAGPQNLLYTVTVGNCTASLSQTITGLDPNIVLSNTDVTCYGLSNGSLSAVASGGSGNYTYSWNTNPAQTTINASNVPAGTYTLTITDVDANCVNIDSITVTQPDSISLEMVANVACYPNLGQALVNATGGAGGFTYEWSDSISTTEAALGLDSAWHAVTVTDANGCTKTDSVFVHVYPLPTMTITPDTTIEYGDYIPLNVTGGETYSWDPSDYLDCDDCPSPIAAPIVDTYYCATVTDSNTCESEICVLVKVVIVCGDVFVPSAFSPNGDGENDMLCVYSDCWDQLTLTIYNRWGEVVFVNSNQEICWDGTWKGKELNSGVFVYTLDGFLINNELVQQKGNISLIR